MTGKRNRIPCAENLCFLYQNFLIFIVPLFKKDSAYPDGD